MNIFPVTKLEKLPYKTALRKIALVLQRLEMDCAAADTGAAVPAISDYLESLSAFLGRHSFPDPLARALPGVRHDSGQEQLRAINRLRHALLSFLGAEPAEWDLLDPEKGTLDRGARTAHPLTVFLEEIRSPFNVGSIFRTAEALGAARIVLSPLCASPEHERARRTARGAGGILPWSFGSLSELPAFGPVFALETGGRDIGRFCFPKQGTVLVGSEELGLSPEALALADSGLGRVSIPLAGAKRSLNVAVAFGILMQYWLSSLKSPS